MFLLIIAKNLENNSKSCLPGVPAIIFAGKR
jgi:hypothetical protein